MNSRLFPTVTALQRLAGNHPSTPSRRCARLVSGGINSVSLPRSTFAAAAVATRKTLHAPTGDGKPETANPPETENPREHVLPRVLRLRRVRRLRFAVSGGGV